MSDLPRRNNTTLSDWLQQLKHEVAPKAAWMSLDNHPEWLLNDGDHDWQRGIELVLQHLDFLAAALDANTPTVFEDYCMWAADSWEHRAVSASVLVVSLTQIEICLCSRLAPSEQGIIGLFLEAGRASCAHRETIVCALDPFVDSAEKLDLSISELRTVSSPSLKEWN